MPQNYRVRIKIPNIEVEIESTDSAYVDKRLKEYLAEYQFPGVNLGGSAIGNVFPGEKGLSIQEFLLKLKPEKDTEYLMGVAYFLEKYQGLKEIKRKDVDKGFRDIKYKHSNPSEPIRRASKQGFLMDGKTKGSYLLTNTGEAWIAKRIQVNAKES